MTITHIVLFEFRADAAPEAVQGICEGVLALKDKCLHPETQKPYIISVKGGKDNSPEGNQGGLTHGFVMEFANAADRDYYAKTDPVHQALIKTLRTVLAQVRVLDFEGGVFEWTK